MAATVSHRLGRCITTLFGVALAGAAHAAAVPFTTSLAVQFLDTAPLAIPAAGTAIVNGSAGGSHVHSLALAGSTFAVSGAVQPITDPAAFPVMGVQLTAHNGAGTFTDASGSLGGIMPLAGSAKVCLFGPCSSAVANLDVPLSVVGQGGIIWIQGAVYMTVIGAPWTTGTAVAGSATRMGLAHGPASGTSSTFAPGGEIQLVTPILVQSDLGLFANVPGFAVLSLHFVPEPGTIALLGAGSVLLAIIGRARRRD